MMNVPAGMRTSFIVTPPLRSRSIVNSFAGCVAGTVERLVAAWPWPKDSCGARRNPQQAPSTANTTHTGKATLVWLMVSSSYWLVRRESTGARNPRQSNRATPLLLRNMTAPWPMQSPQRQVAAPKIGFRRCLAKSRQTRANSPWAGCGFHLGRTVGIVEDDLREGRPSTPEPPR